MGWNVVSISYVKKGGNVHTWLPFADGSLRTISILMLTVRYCDYYKVKEKKMTFTVKLYEIELPYALIINC